MARRPKTARQINLESETPSLERTALKLLTRLDDIQEQIDSQQVRGTLHDVLETEAAATERLAKKALDKLVSIQDEVDRLELRRSR